MKNTFMRDNTAQQKRHALGLRTKKNEIDKRRYKGEDQGKFDCISLGGQMKCLHAD